MRENKLNIREKEDLRDKLYKRYGEKCHYCGIGEKQFEEKWGLFYGIGKRGLRLEIDRKDNEEGYKIKNCVLACSVCNNAKSDKFTYEEFKKVGVVIKEVWQKRKRRKRKPI